MKRALLALTVLLTGCGSWVDSDDVVTDETAAIAIAVRVCHPSETVDWTARLDHDTWFVTSDHLGLYHVSIDKWSGKTQGCTRFAP